MIFHQIWIRIRRKPWLCAVIFLFAVVMSLALCSLSHGTDAALAEYETVCAQVPIRCTVTNLTGNQSDNLEIYHGILGLFTGSLEDTPRAYSGHLCGLTGRHSNKGIRAVCV